MLWLLFSLAAEEAAEFFLFDSKLGINLFVEVAEVLLLILDFKRRNDYLAAAI